MQRLNLFHRSLRVLLRPYDREGEPSTRSDRNAKIQSSQFSASYSSAFQQGEATNVPDVIARKSPLRQEVAFSVIPAISHLFERVTEHTTPAGISRVAASVSDAAFPVTNGDHIFSNPAASLRRKLCLLLKLITTISSGVIDLVNYFWQHTAGVLTNAFR